MSLRAVFYIRASGDVLTGGPRELVTLIDLLRDRVAPLVLTQQGSALTAALAERGIPARIVPMPPPLSDKTPGVAGPARALLDYGRELAIAAAPHQPQVWCARNARGVLLSAPAARRLRVPLVWDVALERPSRGFERVVHACATLGSAHIVLQADNLRHAIGPLARWLGRTTTIPFGLPKERTDALRGVAVERAASRRNDGQALRVLCLGTLNDRKNPLLLVEALGMLGRDAEAFEVRLVGDAPDAGYAARLRARITELRLGNVVRVHGWRPDVAALMRDSDLLVLCSRAEGLPLVVREAAFAALPVLATAVGGVPDAIAHRGTGLVVRENDAPALAEQLRWATDHRAELAALGAAAAARAEDAYSARRWADQYFALLQRLAGAAA